MNDMRINPLRSPSRLFKAIIPLTIPPTTHHIHRPNVDAMIRRGQSAILFIAIQNPTTFLPQNPLCPYNPKRFVRLRVSKLRLLPVATWAHQNIADFAGRIRRARLAGGGGGGQPPSVASRARSLRSRSRSATICSKSSSGIQVIPKRMWAISPALRRL